MFAVKNSMKRQEACSPARTIIAGNCSKLARARSRRAGTGKCSDSITSVFACGYILWRTRSLRWQPVRVEDSEFVYAQRREQFRHPKVEMSKALLFADDVFRDVLRPTRL